MTNQEEWKGKRPLNEAEPEQVSGGGFTIYGARCKTCGNYMPNLSGGMPTEEAAIAAVDYYNSNRTVCPKCGARCTFEVSPIEWK